MPTPGAQVKEAAAAKEVIDSVTTMILTTVIMPGVAISTFSAN